MRTRSGKTTWTCVALLVLVSCGSIARAQSGQSVQNKVNLILQISGLGPEGCEIEIKPGHPGCHFDVVNGVVKRVPSGSVAKLDAIAIMAESTGADRDCSFAITIKEPGQQPRTFRRGLRLASPTAEKPLPNQTLRCYLSSASLAAQTEDEVRRR